MQATRTAVLVAAGMALATGATCAAAQDNLAPRSVRGFVSVGALGGGERLSSVEVSTSGGGSTTLDVRAGGSFEARGGIDIALAPQWSLQLSAGYVSGGVRASNGKVTFTAYPVEVLGHYRIHDAWRVGGGLRAPLNAKYRESGVAGNVNADFDARVTPVVEVEWLIGSRFGVKLRGMQESYTVKGTSIKVDGNAVGLSGSFYF